MSRLMARSRVLAVTTALCTLVATFTFLVRPASADADPGAAWHGLGYYGDYMGRDIRRPGMTEPGTTSYSNWELLMRFEEWLGRPVWSRMDYANAHAGGWANFESSAISFSRSFGHPSQPGGPGTRRSIIGLPLTIASGTLAEVAAGRSTDGVNIDRVWKRIATEYANAPGMNNTIFRLGWEMDGPHYPWAARGKAQDYIAAYRRVVSIMRTVPGQQFEFTFESLASGFTRPRGQRGRAEAYYPGDDVVDYIGIDFYDNTPGVDYPGAENVWRTRIEPRLAAMVNFAEERGKHPVIGEWGLAAGFSSAGVARIVGGDNAYLVDRVLQFIDDNDIAWHNYFDRFAPAHFDGPYRIMPYEDIDAVRAAYDDPWVQIPSPLPDGSRNPIQDTDHQFPNAARIFHAHLNGSSAAGRSPEPDLAPRTPRTPAPTTVAPPATTTPDASPSTTPPTPTTTTPPSATAPSTTAAPPTTAVPTTTAPDDSVAGRLARLDGVMHLYDLTDGSGFEIFDRTGDQDLLISGAGPTWDDEGLALTGRGRVLSFEPVDAFVAATRASREMTALVELTPETTSQNGRTRVLSISTGVGARNLSLYHGGPDNDVSGRIGVGMRTTVTNHNGTPDFFSDTVMPAGRRQILALTHDDTHSRVYLDGALVAERRNGGVPTWRSGQRLILGSEADGRWPWLGTLHTVALFDRALSIEELTELASDTVVDETDHDDVVAPTTTSPDPAPTTTPMPETPPPPTTTSPSPPTTAPPPTTTAAPTPEPADGVVAQWDFADANGPIVSGTGAAAAPLTVGAGTESSASGLVFDGADTAVGSAVEITTRASVATDVSIEMWLTPERSAGPILTLTGGRLDDLVIGQNLTGAAHHDQLEVLLHSTGRYSRLRSGARTLPTGAPVHVVVTRSSGRFLQIYIDGDIVATRLADGALGVWGADEMVIGGDGWIGTVHELTIHDRTLSAPQVAAAAAAGI